MSVATLIMAAIAAVVLAMARRKGDGSDRRGALQGWRTLRATFPLLVLAYIIVGYVTVLLPREGLQEWLGPHSGLKGLLMAEALGILVPGGPYVVLPLIGTLHQLGTGLGPTVTLFSAWACISLLNSAWEIRFMGLRYTLVRTLLTLIFPALSGLLAQSLFE